MKKNWPEIILIGAVLITVIIVHYLNFDSPSNSHNELNKFGTIQTEKHSDGKLFLIYNDNDTVLTEREKHHLNYLMNYYDTVIYNKGNNF